MDPRTAKTPLFATDGISWVGLFAGPLAWVLDEEVGYFIADWSCRSGHRWATYAVSAGALALAGVGAAVSWHEARQQRAAGNVENRPPARMRFLALAGLLLCLLFGLVVLVDLAAKFYFDPCQR